MSVTSGVLISMLKVRLTLCNIPAKALAVYAPREKPNKM